MRYADPNLCPDCRSPLPPGTATCPTCSLIVRHPLAVEVFSALQRADLALSRLRLASTAPAVATAEPRVPLAQEAIGQQTDWKLEVEASGGPRVQPRSGVRSASVPKILLGLGALCLLVAAITFLAVSWSSMGVGARTAVLVAFTALAGASSLGLLRHDLRIGAESMSVVTLGLLGLDVVGAGSAGWFGEPSVEAIGLATGVVLALAGTGTGLVSFAGRARLVAPQVVATAGLLLAWVSSAAMTDHHLVAGHVFTAVALAGAALGASAGARALMFGAAGAGTLLWTVTCLNGLVLGIEHPALGAVWGDGAGWSLLATAGFAVAPGLAARRTPWVQAGGSVAALVVTAAAALPCLEASLDTVATTALVITAAWTLALALLPSVLRAVAVAPASIGSTVLALFVLGNTSAAIGRWLQASFDGDAWGVRLYGENALVEPLLTVPALLVVVAAGRLLLRQAGVRPAAADVVQTMLAAGGIGVAVTTACLDLPVAVPVAAIVATASGMLGAALAAHGSRQAVLGVCGLALLLLGVGGAAPWAGLLMVVALVAAGFLAALHARAESGDLRAVAGFGLAPAIALAAWSLAELVELDVDWRAVPIMVLVGILAIVRPRLEIEVPAVVTGTLVAVTAVTASTDLGSALALHLTVAGCLVTATALINESRREVAWAGAGLLLLATWVRLGDLGVTAPEPYTLPAALGLIAIGLWHLDRRPEASTATALTPGLLLATVPSLLWVLADPASPRAVVLGLAMIALTVAGAVLRWSAPLLVGASVGAVVILRELGPYAGTAPAWVWMALGGTLLVVVGITWERRLLELRSAVDYLGRLR